jgi:hypothetical protein
MNIFPIIPSNSFSVVGYHTSEKSENIRLARGHHLFSEDKRKSAILRAGVGKSPQERLAELNAAGLVAAKERGRIAKALSIK